MAEKSTSAVISLTTSGGEKISKTISDINPEATSEQIVAFAKGLNSLTTNTYVNTTKVTKEELSETARTQTTIELGTEESTTISLAKITTDGFETRNFYTNSNGEVVVKSNNTRLCLQTVYYNDPQQPQPKSGLIIALPDLSIADIEDSHGYATPDYQPFSDTGTFVVYIEETDEFTRSPELTFTVTA